MERTNAERVFALLADINGDLKGKVVSERWWLVWVVMGLQILVTSTITQVVIWNGVTDLTVFLAIWGVHVALIPPVILFIHRRGGGQRTATETYIWFIWSAFIACSTIAAFFSKLVIEPQNSAAPMVALLAAFAWAMMAMVTHRLFLLCAAAFLGVMLLMVLFPAVEFLVFGGAWCIVLVGLGLVSRATIRPHEGKFL